MKKRRRRRRKFIIFFSYLIVSEKMRERKNKLMLSNAFSPNFYIKMEKKIF